MAARGALALSRALRMRVEVPEFTQSRFAQRYNMMHEDRLKWYNWNLACIAITAIPVAYMCTVEYRTTIDTETIQRTLNPIGDLKIKYDLNLYAK
mmetsp:Transcript_5385/g.14560  ORF Transcript_5385/g.14560 Transcript_5385/m.14560 type:complete len:95 (+) Transcript_5385:220-504(+)